MSHGGATWTIAHGPNGLPDQLEPCVTVTSAGTLGPVTVHKLVVETPRGRVEYTHGDDVEGALRAIGRVLA